MEAFVTEIGARFKFFQPLVANRYKEPNVKVLEIRKLPKGPGWYAVRVDRPSYKNDAIVFHIVDTHGPTFVTKGAFVLPPGKDLRYLKELAPQFYEKEK